MAKEKELRLTDGSQRALEILKQASEPITMAQMNEVSDFPIASAHLTALTKNQLALAEKRDFVCPTCGAKSSKNVYVVTDAGKAFENPAE